MLTCNIDATSHSRHALQQQLPERLPYVRNSCWILQHGVVPYTREVLLQGLGIMALTSLKQTTRTKKKHTRSP